MSAFLYLLHAPFILLTPCSPTSLKLSILLSAVFMSAHHFTDVLNLLFSVIATEDISKNIQNLYICYTISLDSRVNMKLYCSVNFLHVQGLIMQEYDFAQGIITINHKACFFITGHNRHCMFGTYWLAFGSTCLFINHTTICLPVFNICLSWSGWNTWSAINLIVSWQQHALVWLKL